MGSNAGNDSGGLRAHADHVSATYILSLIVSLDGVMASVPLKAGGGCFSFCWKALASVSIVLGDDGLR